MRMSNTTSVEAPEPSPSLVRLRPLRPRPDTWSMSTATGDFHGPPGAAERVDLEAVDAAVEAAIRAGRPGPLRVLGYGEITLVLGWPTERPTVAVKRLPVFRNRAQFKRYGALLDSYVAELERRGVSVLPPSCARPGRRSRMSISCSPSFRGSGCSTACW